MRLFLWPLALLAGVSLVYPAKTAETLPAAHAAPAPLRVAVIDSGVARTPELRNIVVAEFDMAAARPPYQPDDDHGTMVATILAREAKQPIEIVSLRIDDPAGCPPGLAPPCQARAEPVAMAIRQATLLGVAAINISLNLKEDPLIVDAVRDAARRGIRVVIAAGNDGLDHPGNLTMAKAGYPNVILVGALDAEGRPWEGTNRPQAGTPGYRYEWQWGVDVPTMRANGSSAIATGTSFAAPIVSAALFASEG